MWLFNNFTAVEVEPIFNWKHNATDSVMTLRTSNQVYVACQIILCDTTLST